MRILANIRPLEVALLWLAAMARQLGYILIGIPKSVELQNRSLVMKSFMAVFFIAGYFHYWALGDWSFFLVFWMMAMYGLLGAFALSLIPACNNGKAFSLFLGTSAAVDFLYSFFLFFNPSLVESLRILFVLGEIFLYIKVLSSYVKQEHDAYSVWE